ncbi:MAG: hypothetical protein ABW133_00640 [Polyangiaceae bacterium]
MRRGNRAVLALTAVPLATLIGAFGAFTAPTSAHAAPPAASTGALPAGHPPLGAAAKVAPPSSSTLPPGHPTVAPPSSSALPPGHPTTARPRAAQEEDDDLPPGHPPARGGPSRGMPEAPPEDLSERDISVPAGTIVVEVRDKDDQPLPNVDVTLGILQQSVAKGESRRRTIQKADAQGSTRFENLERGGGIAYRVSIPWTVGTTEPATYAAPPFQLDPNHGQRVRLHVFPVTNRIEETLLGMQGIAYFELKDDVVQVDQLFQVFNMGTTTWVPTNVVIDLPKGFKAFNAQRDMSDAGFDAVPDRGAKMRGTFAPGQHEVQFRYQIPYEATESIKIALALPPRVIRMRVIAEASRTMTLKVDEFPNAESSANQRGQRVLLTERQSRAGESPMKDVAVTLDNIPTEGSARWVTVALTLATIGFGFYFALEQEKEKSKRGTTLAGDRDTERARARLVAEIAALDAASSAGEIGPQAHARIRQALIDSLARIMAGAHEPT